MSRAGTPTWILRTPPNWLVRRRRNVNIWKIYFYLWAPRAVHFRRILMRMGMWEKVNRYPVPDVDLAWTWRAAVMPKLIRLCIFSTITYSTLPYEIFIFLYTVLLDYKDSYVLFCYSFLDTLWSIYIFIRGIIFLCSCTHFFFRHTVDEWWRHCFFLISLHVLIYFIYSLSSYINFIYIFYKEFWEK